MNIKRGDIVLINLGPVIGYGQRKTIPALIIQNDVGNKYSSTTIIVSITLKKFEKEYLKNVHILAKGSGLEKNSTILLNQIGGIDKRRVIRKTGKVSSGVMKKVEVAISKSLGFSKFESL